MPALPIPQQSDWNNNVYVLATSRIFVMIGVAYLIKSLYNLVPSMWGTRSASVAADVADDIDLGDFTSDNPVTLPGVAGSGPDLEANLTLGVRPPQPSHDHQGRGERSRVNTRAQHHGTEVSGFSTASHAMPEQDVGVRNNNPHTEEGVDIAVGMTT